MKVLLTTLNSKYIHTCLAIKYLYQNIKNNCECYLREYTINENIDFIFSQIYLDDYDVIGFSCYIWNIEQILKLCSLLKLVNPRVKIVLGGPEVSFESVKLLQENKCIDFIIKGEGEFIFKDLIFSLKNNQDFYDIDNLVYKSLFLPNYSGFTHTNINNEYIIENKSCGPICDLSSILSPYYDITEEEIDNKIIYYETSRGCNYNCSYCLSSTIKGVRFFPMDNVKHDLKKLVIMNVKQIKFVDRTFNSNKQHTIELIKFLKEIDNGDINFHFEITAHLIDRDFLEQIKNSRYGLFQLEIGVQSTNPLTLNAVNRVDDFEIISRNVNIIKNFGNVHQHLDLIAGLPFETLEIFKKSFNDVFSLQPEALQLGFLKILKGSPLKNEVKKYGYIYKNYPPYEIISNNFLTTREIIYLKNIEGLLDIYYNSGMFHLSIYYLFKTIYIDNPFELFENLLEYKNKIYKNQNISRDSNYEFLLNFVKSNFPDEVIKFKELLRFDYLRLGRTRVIPINLRIDNIEIDKNIILKWLSSDKLRDFFGYHNEHPMQMIKKIHIEYFDYDIYEYILNKKDLKKIKSIIAFDYRGKKDIINKVKFIGGSYEQIDNR